MAPKRSSSPILSDNEHDNTTESPSPSSDTPYKPTPKRSSTKRGSATDPSTPAKKGRKSNTTTPAGEAAAGTIDWSKIPGLTPEKKEAIVNRLFTEGAAAVGSAKLAAEFGLGPVAMRDAIRAGRPGNLRDKAVKAVRG